MFSPGEVPGEAGVRRTPGANVPTLRDTPPAAPLRQKYAE